jgi:hypothetical protein
MMFYAMLTAALPTLLLAADACTDAKNNVECSNCDFTAYNSTGTPWMYIWGMYMSPKDWNCSGTCGVGLSGNAAWGSVTTPNGNP